MLSLPFHISFCKALPPQRSILYFCRRSIATTTSNDRKNSLPAPAATKAHSGLKDEDKRLMDRAVQLPEGLHKESMPRHVAVIMDGNSRWAKQRGLLTQSGHEAGLRSLKEFKTICRQWGIKVLTVFAFSLDNWNRHKEEVDFVMSLIDKFLKRELDDYMREGTRFSAIGDSSRLPSSLQTTISETEEKTRDNSRFHFIMALSYSGTYEIAQACKNIAQKVKDDAIQVEDINEKVIEQELQTKCCEFPCPDLLIRTSGELRISNFLQWQSAYSELFFANACWPDFGKEEFIEALTSYQRRQRRYGRRYA